MNRTVNATGDTTKLCEFDPDRAVIIIQAPYTNTAVVRLGFTPQVGTDSYFAELNSGDTLTWAFPGRIYAYSLSGAQVLNVTSVPQKAFEDYPHWLP